MSQPGTGTSSGATPEVAGRASSHQTSPMNGAVKTSSGGVAADTDPELLKQQLQLIQLCFAEHEFGIVVDEDGAEDSSSSSDSSSASSRSSSSVGGADEPSSSSSSPNHGPHRPARRDRHYTAYDPLALVKGKVQHGVPLAVLSQDLHSYAQYLEDKIAECVNTDVHTAFVNVSGHLVGMRDELSCMERPLTVVMEKLRGAVTHLSTTSLTVRGKVEAACAAELERTFDSVYLRGIVVYETIAYQLGDLAQMLQITVDAAQSRSPAVTASPSTGGSVQSSSAHDGAAKSSTGGGGAAMKREAYSMGAGARLSEATLDVLEDVVLLFQELKEVSQRLVSLPSRQQERVEMAQHVAAAEQAVLGVLEVILVHVSRSTFGGAAATANAVAAGGAAEATKTAAAKEGLEGEAPSSLAARQLLGRVIELYGQAGEREQFCAVFRNAVLRPPLEAVVSWKAATQARQSAEGTVALLQQMTAVLQTAYLPLLPLLRESYGASLHPVATIVWPILSETLVKKLPSLYEVGIPNHFHVKYKAAYRVLAMVEAACADLDELAALRRSPDVVLWNHKWNLDVYAALRVSEVDKALQSVASPLDRLPPTGGAGYHLRIFYIVHQQLLHLFSPSVFLYLCTPRFLRQTAACCYRVLQRVQEAIAKAPVGTVSPAGGAGGGAAAGEAGDDAQRGGSHASSPSADGVSGGTGEASASDTLLLAIADADALRRFLTGPLLQCILERLSEEGETVVSDGAESNAGAGAAASAAVAATSGSAPAERSTAALVTDVVEFAGSTVCGQFLQHARATLVRQVSEAAVVPLQNIKSVRSAYSHTRKTIPSAASWYVAPVLQPLQRFAVEAQRCGFDGAVRVEALIEMLRSLVHQFVVLAKDTLITAKKTEESWEKLRRRKEGGGGSGAGGGGAGGAADGAEEAPGAAGAGQRVTMATATDRDKMTIQLWMDAQALQQGVQQTPLSIPAAVATEAFAPAFQLLRRAEWIQGADIPEPPDVDA